jgi:hypothetical protein
LLGGEVAALLVDLADGRPQAVTEVGDERQIVCRLQNFVTGGLSIVAQVNAFGVDAAITKLDHKTGMVWIDRLSISRAGQCRQREGDEAHAQQPFAE